MAFRSDPATSHGRRAVLTGGSAAAVGFATTGRSIAADGGLVKRAVHNPDKGPNSGTHALRLRNVGEWMVFAGHAAIGAHGEILYPGDALGQLRWI